MVEVLIKVGVNVNLKDDFKLLLIILCFSGYLSIVRILL